MSNRELCDKCGVPAAQTWLDEADRMLTFCNHHGNERADLLDRAGFVLVEASLVPA